tara:strand:- start:185 stop:409 length:225 start_codon:yes stop_codon:yes gene_type:complete
MMVGFGAGPYFSGSIAELQTGTNYLLLACFFLLLALNMKTNSAPPKYAMHQCESCGWWYNKGEVCNRSSCIKSN